MQFTIRNMLPADVEELVAIESISFPAESNMTREMFLREMNLPMARLKGAVNDTVRGYLNYWLIDDEVHIIKIAVSPEYRRMGLGQMLFQDMLAENPKARTFHLELRESNDSARGFYEKYGFVVCGRRAHYYAHKNEDALLMILKKN